MNPGPPTDLELRLAQIEQRLAALERERRPLAPRPSAPAAPRAAPPVPRSPSPVEPLSADTPDIYTEQWVGQRGLLAIGVLLVILSVGYMLKLSFDRGWVSPVMRCTGGVAFGLAASAIGWRLHRNLRRYGASIIGLGFGIVYVAIWAAARLYQLVPPGIDIASLALVSLGFAAVAFILDVEGLGAAAALGAFMAPVVQGTGGNPDALLVYLALVAATIGVAAATRKWRFATLVVGLSYFALGTVAATGSPNPIGLLAFGAFGGLAGLMVGLREKWVETRFLAFSFGWGLLWAANDRLDSHWLTTIAAGVLAAAVWHRALTSPAIWPDRRGQPSWAESFYFYATAIMLGWAVTQLAPAWFSPRPGYAAALVGAVYLSVGYAAPRYPFALVGATAMAVAALDMLEAHRSIYLLTAFSVTWAALDHRLDRDDGRWYGVGTLAVALWWLLGTAGNRPTADPAFVGGWAIACWLCVAAAAILAARGWRRMSWDQPPAEKVGADEPWSPDGWVPSGKTLAHAMPARLWATAGLVLFLGVTVELRRLFQGESLWSGLAVSAWWAAFAAALVLQGFQRGLRGARVAGLIVAGLAIAKVLLIDLSSLDAFYRIASVFILGLVSLLLAYLYHRYTKGELRSDA